MRADEWRILVGDDAVALDELVREMPGEAYDESFVEIVEHRVRSSTSRSDGVGMLYGDLVAASQRVAATSKRSEKVAALADAVAGDAARTRSRAAIGLLIGDPRQGRLGVGWVTMSNLQVTPAIESSLTIHDVDDALTRVACDRGQRLAGRAGQGDDRPVVAPPPRPSSTTSTGC